MHPALESFCDRFATGAGASGTWALVDSGMGNARTHTFTALLRSGEQCPLTAQARVGHPRRRVDARHAMQAIRRLAAVNGLTLRQALAVMDAADRTPGHDPVLRARLLAGCSLTEEA